MFLGCLLSGKDSRAGTRRRLRPRRLVSALVVTLFGCFFSCPATWFGGRIALARISTPCLGAVASLPVVAEVNLGSRISAGYDSYRQAFVKSRVSQTTPDFTAARADHLSLVGD